MAADAELVEAQPYIGNDFMSKEFAAFLSMHMAKAIIIIVSAENKFTQEQIHFIKRMVFCLKDHHKLSVAMRVKEKASKGSYQY